MAHVFLADYTERQNRSLNRIVEMLSAAESRMEPAYKHSREHDRRDFHGRILVCLPTSESSEPSEHHPSTYPAWAYNLSQGGVGFVATVKISQRLVSIGLKRTDGTYRWISGRIVRSRPVPGEEFVDYGVSFRRPPAEPTHDATAVAGVN